MNLDYLKEDDNIDNGKIRNSIIDDSEQIYKEKDGSGRVLVLGKSKINSKDKIKKLIYVSKHIKDKLDKMCVGSQVQGIEALLAYGLDKLEQESKDLEV